MVVKPYRPRATASRFALSSPYFLITPYACPANRCRRCQRSANPSNRRGALVMPVITGFGTPDPSALVLREGLTQRSFHLVRRADAPVTSVCAVSSPPASGPRRRRQAVPAGLWW